MKGHKSYIMNIDRASLPFRCSLIIKGLPVTWILWVFLVWRMSFFVKILSMTKTFSGVWLPYENTSHQNGHGENDFHNLWAEVILHRTILTFKFILLSQTNTKDIYIYRKRLFFHEMSLQVDLALNALVCVNTSNAPSAFSTSSILSSSFLFPI